MQLQTAHIILTGTRGSTMAVELKSGNSTDLGTVDPTSKALRVTAYNSDGVEGTREIPVSLTVAPVTVEDNDVISSIDVTEYKFISLQLTGTWVGTVSFQGSNDNGTFYDIVSQDTSSTTAPYSSTRTTVGLVKIPVTYKYFRARVTAYASGTVTGTAYGHKEDKVLSAVGQIGEVTLAAETSKVIGTVNVSELDNATAGTITSADTSIVAPNNDGTLLTGTPSANSYVFLLSEAKDSTWSAEITGTMGSSSFYFEGSASSTDGVNGSWTGLNAVQTGKLGAAVVNKATVSGEYKGNNAGIKYFRVRAVGGTGINANIKIRYASGTSSVFLTESLPAGTNGIGKVSLEAGTAIIGKVALEAGTNIIGSVRSLPASSATLQTDFFVGVGGNLNGNSRLIRSQASTLRSLVMSNYTAGARHVKIFDTGTTPVAGEGTPVLVVSLAASGTIAFPLPAEGLSFANGIGMTMTLGPANNDTTSTATGPDFTLVSIFT